ncbi:SIR2 family protein [Pendulispora rubella]|uniref:SIR2 family protein n=1 Tax=Pendulispora rubella TaxID=2741070 RepID=A0ABZ2LB86_9BACT
MSPREALLNKLRKTLERPDTVLLVGSGASCAAGLPGWGKFLRNLATFVQECGENAEIVLDEIGKVPDEITGDPLLAASYAVTQLNPRDFGQFIREQCKVESVQPAEIHRTLVRLGPTCFITTNYDQLIERALVEYKPNDRPRVVTNRQPLEVADIITAQARNFIFKYHGDVMDAESIVLSREHYRKMLGELSHVFTGIKSILATRPMVLIGFGLRDPDFLLLKDTLAATLSGHAGEHYAIMCGFDEAKRRYWKQNYNIDIISYENPDGRHAELLSLLKGLRQVPSVQTPPAASSSDEQRLKLLRLAARMKELRPQNALELPLKVRPRTSRTAKSFSNATKTLGTLPELLRTHAKSFVLTGDPGSGKSFALKSYAADMGTALNAACLDESADIEQKPIALYIDLASYAGDLRALLQEQLPTGLLLDDLLKTRPCTVLLDAVNEIPRESQEDWERDILTFVNAPNTKDCRLVLSVRDGHSMARLNLPVYTVDGIEESFVVAHFRGRRLPTIFDHGEMVNLFTKPSFFSLAYNRIIDIDRVVTAKDVYAALFQHVNTRWAATHPARLDFVPLLSGIAFEAISSGREYIPVEDIRERCAHGRANLRGDDAIDFLMAEGILLVRPGLRVTFFHQSVTEFLAAVEIANRYRQSSEIIEEILRDRRWDHATLFALSSLPRDAAAVLFARIVSVDIVLALRATQFLRDGRNGMIASVLKEVSLCAKAWAADNDLEHMLDVADALASLHVGPEHQRELEGLARRGGPLGGVAAGLSFKMTSDESAIVGLLNGFDDDYGFITSLVGTVRDHANYPFVHALIYWVRENYLPNASRGRRRLDGISRVGELIQVLPSREAEKLVLEFIDAEGYVREALYEGLKAWDGAFARKHLMQLIKRGSYDAAWALHTNLTYYAYQALPAEFEVDTTFADAIVSGTADESAGHWALHVCKSLTSKNPQWRDALRQSAEARTTSFGRMLLEVYIDDDEERVKRTLTELVASSHRLTDSQRLALGRSQPWRSRPPEAGFAILLTENCRMSEGVLSALGGGIDRTSVRPFSHRPFPWWLEWMERCENANDELHRTCAHRIGAFLAKSDWTMNRIILQQFNRADISESTFRMIGKHIVPRMADVSTLSLSDTALRRLLDSIGTPTYDDEMGRPLLGLLATENFVIHQLLPLWIREDQTKSARPHLARILEVAGRRHGRRYGISA